MPGASRFGEDPSVPVLRHRGPARGAHASSSRLGVVAVRVGGLALAIAVAAALIPQLSVQPGSAPAGAGDGVARAGGDAFPPAETPSPAPRVVLHPPSAPAPDAPVAVPVERLEGYVWPLPNGRLTQRYGPSRWGSRIVDGERFHDGIDLATFCGDRIVAAHDGVVLAAGRRFDRFLGWRGDLAPYERRLERKKAWSSLPIVVVVDDGNGYRSVYAHFRRAVVDVGDTVRAGDLLGHEGATGNASGCHLHYTLFSPWETRVFGLNPESAARMRLPPFMTARVDPLLVLPERPAPNANAKPKSRPTASPVPSSPG